MAILKLIKRGLVRLKNLILFCCFVVWLFFYCCWYWVRGRKPPNIFN